MKNIIRIATRKSPLALWQANFVKTQLESLHSHLKVELVTMVTKGDVMLDTPLAKIGGKGLFVKELEVALLTDQADIAVHSMKDVPMQFPQGLELSTVCKREDPRDAFVSNCYDSLEALPKGAIVGTSSLRRQCQLKYQRPDLTILNLRGNVGTRLAKLDHGEYDAIILAAAGLIRLGLSERITQFIDDTRCLPAVGQGAVGIESRIGDSQTQAYLAPIMDWDTYYCIQAERAMNAYLQGGCQVPIAGFAQIENGLISMRALVGDVSGERILRAEGSATRDQAQNLGEQLAKDLFAQGADQILQDIYSA